MGIFISTISAVTIIVSSVISPYPSATLDRPVNNEDFTIQFESTEDIKPLEPKEEEQRVSPTYEVVEAETYEVDARIAISQTEPQSPTSLTEDQMNFLGNCESGMRAERNSGNGYYGAFQFSIGTWNSMGTGYERADLAPMEVQKDAVQRLLQRSSIFTQFPGCSARMRALGLI